MSRLPFPLWQIDEQVYGEVCAYIGVTPRRHLYERLTDYLASAPFRFARPAGFSRHLARLRLTRFTIARLDLVTKLFFPDHPLRHALNGVIALHECDDSGFREMASSPTGWRAVVAMLGWLASFCLGAALTLPWLAWQFVTYVAGVPFRPAVRVAGKRVLVTGVSRGLGLDLMLDCLEGGAEVIGTVRNRQSLADVQALLPKEAPAKLLIAELSQPGGLVQALREAGMPAESLHLAILCAGVKHDGEPVWSLGALRETFQVNFFAAAEFAAWFCTPASPPINAGNGDSSAALNLPPPQFAAGSGTRAEGPPRSRALVLISSMGRWHGMHFAGGYNASKAALSIWGESLDMELRCCQTSSLTVTIVEPGIFDSGMTRRTPLTRFLFASRRDVASRILSGALAGRRTIRPPFWFALLTWGVCLAGRDLRFRLFARAKPVRDR